MQMKKWRLILFFLILLLILKPEVNAQCSICTRTAQQMGEKPARGLNAGILYLALTPFAIAGVIAFRFFKRKETGKP